MKYGRMSALAVGVALAVSACGSASDDGSMPGMDMTSESSSSAEEAAEDHNDADVMFAQMMIPHHSQAIEMSDIVLAKPGVDSRVTDLAQQIKDAQGPEINEMTMWLEGWGAEVPSSMEGMEGMDHGGSMGGMMSAEDMEALEAADGTTASSLFLEQMIEHHEGAIEMAQAEVSDGQSEDAVTLAQSIVDSQQAEIAEMESLLATL